MDNKTVIYARISTDGQTVEQQIETCKRYCTFKQLKVDEIIIEVASGKGLSKRPKFREMWDKLRAYEWNNVVAFKIDRYGRNTRDMVMFFDEMKSKGIQVHSATENLDMSTPMGQAMIYIMMVLAQLERENISLATKDRLQALKNMGKTLGRPKGSKDEHKRKKSGYYGNKNRTKKGGVKNHAK